MNKEDWSTNLNFVRAIDRDMTSVGVTIRDNSNWLQVIKLLPLAWSARLFSIWVSSKYYINSRHIMFNAFPFGLGKPPQDLLDLFHYPPVFLPTRPFEFQHTRHVGKYPSSDRHLKARGQFPTLEWQRHLLQKSCGSEAPCAGWVCLPGSPLWKHSDAVQIHTPEWWPGCQWLYLCRGNWRERSG